MSFFKLGEESILIAGIIFLGAACILPNVLKYKEEKMKL